MSGAQRSEKMFILAWGQSGLHSGLHHLTRVGGVLTHVDQVSVVC